MSDNHGGKSRHRPPVTLSNYLTNKSSRSRSISNTLEQEPKLHPVRIFERQLSQTKTEPRNHVAQLIQQFENSQSTEHVQKTVRKLQRTPSVVYSTSTNQNSVRQTVSTAIEIPRTALVQSKSVPNSFSELELETITHSTSSYLNSDDTDSVVTMTQPSLLISEEFIRSQSVVANDEELTGSFDENKSILLERIYEICSTEETYIKTLGILSSKLPVKMREIFRKKDENLRKLFEKIYQPLLQIIQRLYQFHSQIILPNMQTYQPHSHQLSQFWSIFEKQFSTIEELYGSYYLIFDHYQRELKRLEKSDTLKKLHQTMSVCQMDLGNLCPITEFNTPNQRLVRYILLTKTFAKHFEENSSDYEYTNSIQSEFTRIANRCEEQLIVSIGEFQRLKSRLDCKLDCFEHQQLYWHGTIKEQSMKKRNEISRAYLILFSNYLILCDQSGNHKLEIKQQLAVENLVVEALEHRRILSNNSYYPFRVQAKDKMYEFLVEREVERDKWFHKIQQAKEDFQQQWLTNKSERDSSACRVSSSIGTCAPIVIPESDVTRCQICNLRFGMKLVSSNRHCCRSCGRWICSSCATKKLTLQYCLKQGEVRVCDQCYSRATGILRHSISLLKTTRNPNKTILFGNFHCLSTNSMSWFELQDDFTLHIYRGKLDQVDDLSFDLTKLRDLKLNEDTRLFVVYLKDKRYKYVLESNHENNYQEENLHYYSDKILFHARLWYDVMQLARTRKLPLWYMEKRHSTDSGISAV